MTFRRFGAGKRDELGLRLAVEDRHEGRSAQRVDQALEQAAVRAQDEAARIAKAEGLAAEAMTRTAQDPAAALVLARESLALTNEFNPTVFVEMGRKGEVVEDEFQAARAAYGEHRARLYEAVPKLWQEWAFSDRVATPLRPPVHGDSSGVRGAAWLWGPGED